MKKAGSLRSQGMRSHFRVATGCVWEEAGVISQGLCVLSRGLTWNSNSNNSKNINSKTPCVQTIFHLPCIY